MERGKKKERDGESARGREMEGEREKERERDRARERARERTRGRVCVSLCVLVCALSAKERWRVAPRQSASERRTPPI